MFGTLRNIANRIWIIAKPKVASTQTVEEKYKVWFQGLVRDTIDGSLTFKSIQSANIGLVTREIVKFLNSHPDLYNLLSNQPEWAVKALVYSDGVKTISYRCSIGTSNTKTWRWAADKNINWRITGFMPSGHKKWESRYEMDWRCMYWCHRLGLMRGRETSSLRFHTSSITVKSIQGS